MSTSLSEHHVVVTRPVPGPAQSWLDDRANVQVLEEGVAADRSRLAEAISEADGALVLVTERIDEEVLAAAKRLKVVANMAVGYDNIDVAAATRAGVVVTNTPDVLTETSADLTLALLLATARRVVEGDRFLRERRWERWAPLLLAGQDVYGRTLGIAGLGRIGRAVARRAVLGFGMKLIYWGRSDVPEIERELGAERVGRDELFERSDFLSLHLALNDETRHFVSSRELGLMREDSILINTARGPIVDEAALVSALEAGQIWGAGLDVFEEEPSVTEALLPMKNVVLLPHIGSASVATRERMAKLAAENIVAVLSGQSPLNPVNPEVLLT